MRCWEAGHVGKAAAARLATDALVASSAATCRPIAARFAAVVGSAAVPAGVGALSPALPPALLSVLLTALLDAVVDGVGVGSVLAALADGASIAATMMPSSPGGNAHG